MSRWIHVKEALPDKDCMCLIAETDPTSGNDQLYVSLGEFVSDLSEQFSRYKPGPGFISIYDVDFEPAECVHYWMPLPKTPSIRKSNQDEIKYRNVKLPWQRLRCDGCVYSENMYDRYPCSRCYYGEKYKKKPEDVAND